MKIIYSWEVFEYDDNLPDEELLDALDDDGIVNSYERDGVCYYEDVIGHTVGNNRDDTAGGIIGTLVGDKTIEIIK